MTAISLSAVSTARAAETPFPPPLGPISIRDARPYNLLFLRFSPESPATLAPRETRIGAQLDIINNLLRPNDDNGVRIVEDNEMQRLRLTWWRGLKRRLEASVQLPIVARNGGLLDGPISAYHRLLGLPGDARDNPAGRDSFPRGQSTLLWQNSAGTMVDAGDAFGAGDVAVFLKRELGASANFSKRARFSLRLGLKIPTGSSSQLLGSGAPDAGAHFDIDYRISRRWLAFGGIGGVAMGRAKNLPNARTSMLQGVAGIEWRIGRRDSLIFQIDRNTRVVTTGHRFADGAPSTATLGYKHRSKNGRSWFAAFSENGDFHNYNAPLLANIGPDFSLSAGLEWRR